MTDLPTFASAVAAWSDIASAWGISVDQINAWFTGTATGGPHGDGTYPFTNRAGVTVYIPCPDASFAADLIYEGTIIVDPAAGAGDRLPGIHIRRATVFPPNFGSNSSKILGDLPTGSTETFTFRLFKADGTDAEVGTTHVSTSGAVTRATTNPAGFTAPGDSWLIPFGDPAPKGTSGYYETFVGTVQP